MISFRSIKKQKTVDIFITLFFVTLCEEGFESFVNLIYEVTTAGLQLAEEELFFYGSFVLLLFMSTVKFLKLNKIRHERSRLSKFITVGQIVLLISLILMIGSVRELQSLIQEEGLYYLTTILIIFSYFGTVFVGLFVVFTRRSNEEYRYAFGVEAEMRVQQKRNYESILDKEEETRKFRHDFQNHMINLMMMLEDNNIDESKEYIRQIEANMKTIIEKNYATGNKTVDAILNYYFSDLDEDIKLKILGSAAENLKINEVDLCSLISNAIKNAIEAVSNQRAGEREILINMQIMEKYFYIKIQNSCDIKKIKRRKGTFLTSKQDKANHGFGLNNMKQILEKNEGEIITEVEENTFLIVMNIPLESNF
jgi:hypothetical protein